MSRSATVGSSARSTFGRPWFARAREAHGLRFVGHCDLAGHGDGSQLLRRGDRLYVSHMRSSGTTIVDVSDPERPAVTAQRTLPAGLHSHKLQISGDLMLVNLEQNVPLAVRHDPELPSGGVEVFDLTGDPDAPERLGGLEIPGKGVHRMWFDGGRYAYVSAVPLGFRERMLCVLDLAEPAAPQIAGRWWEPGLCEAGGEEPDWPAGTCVGLHHVIVRDGRAYAGMLDGGIVVLDVRDPANPSPETRWTWPGDWGGFAHTVLPLHDGVLAVTQEQTIAGRQRPQRRVRVLRCDDGHVEEIAVMPEPGVPAVDGARFGPHNVHENRSGSQIDPQRLYVAYFGAGLRVYDLSDPWAPVELAAYVPEPPPGQAACQVNDVYVDDELVYISDRVGGGVWILEVTA